MLTVLIAASVAGSLQATAPIPFPPHSLPENAMRPATIVRGPLERAPAQSYISPWDYPSAAGGAAGKVGINLTVSPDGRVLGCRVRLSSGSAALDAATCRIIERRARYIPAVDSSGNTVTGTIDQMVEWKAH